MLSDAWKPIPGFEGRYEASSNGTIRSVDRSVIGKYRTAHCVKGRIVKPFITKWGYAMVSLEQKKFTVHSIIALTFIGERLNGEDVNHINGVKTDNRAENLEYLSRSENHIHAYRIGIKARAILDMEKAREIRKRYAAGGITQKQLADEYGVARPNIGYVLRNMIWREGYGS